MVSEKMNLYPDEIKYPTIIFLCKENFYEIFYAFSTHIIEYLPTLKQASSKGGLGTTQRVVLPYSNLIFELILIGKKR